MDYDVFFEIRKMNLEFSGQKDIEPGSEIAHRPKHESAVPGQWQGGDGKLPLLEVGGWSQEAPSGEAF